MKRKTISGFIIIALCAVVFALPIFYSGNAYADWRSDAYQYFQKDEYDKAISIAERNRGDRFAKMILCFSYLQKYVFTKSALDKQKFAIEYKNLAITTSVKDIDNIGKFTREVAKPEVVKRANRLLKTAFDNLSTNEDIYPIIKYLNWESENSRKLAAGTIGRILKYRRAVVNKGGTLRKKDIALFTHPPLIQGLVKQVDELPNARKALVYIEQPAIPYVEKAGTAGSVKTLSNINKAIARRQKKYPNSNWYSATGQKR